MIVSGGGGWGGAGSYLTQNQVSKVKSSGEWLYNNMAKH